MPAARKTAWTVCLALALIVALGTNQLVYAQSTTIEVTGYSVDSGWGNGTYVQIADVNGRHAYQFDNSATYNTRIYTIRWSGSQWEIHNAYFDDFDYYHLTSTGSEPPASGWYTYEDDPDADLLLTPDTADPEPTNHPTAFAATADSASQITTSWTDSTGGQLPAGYLVLCNLTGTFTAPVDGTAQSDDGACADGSGAMNAAQGTETYAWTGLAANTTYYFQIHPYTNSGTSIDYKTDGVPPAANATTTCYATPTVTSDGDSGAGSLRWAIASACDGGTIDFDLTYPATITLTSGQLAIAKTLTIDGPGAENLAVSGNNTWRVFYIAAGQAVSIDGLTIRDGFVNDPATNGDAGTYTRGAGIRSHGSLTLTHVSLISNTVSIIPGNPGWGTGGALYFGGDALTILDSDIFSNTASEQGGGVYCDSGQLNLAGSTLQSNRAVDGFYPGGGALYSDGCGLVVTHTTWISNTAGDRGGALYLYSDLASEITNSTLRGNTAVYGGGAIYVDSLNGLMVSGTQIVTNTAVDGGGLYVNEALDLTILGGRIGGNTASGQGGGIYFDNDDDDCSIHLVMSGTLVALNQAVDGGGLYSTDANDYYGCGTIEESRFVDNQASGDGGAMYLADDEIDVSKSTFSGNTSGGNGGALWVGYGGTFSDLQMHDNGAGGGGGALYNAGDLSLDDSQVYSNTAMDGGGIYNAGDLVLYSSEIYLNTANSGGALYNSNSLSLDEVTMYVNTASGSGGGIYNDGGQVTISSSRFEWNSSTHADGGAMANDNNGQMTVTGSTFAGNTALASGMDGGAIFSGDDGSSTLAVEGCTFEENRAYEGGAIRSRSLLRLSNSTFYSNTATSGGGGALRLMGTAYITHTTIYSNSAPSGGSGVRISSATGTYSFVNTIVAGSSGGACSTAGGVLGGSSNLATDGTCGASFGQVDSVLLDTLGDYGGDTETVPLLPGSPAIDAGSTAACPAEDQRGVTRPQGSGCDIGAVESRGFALAKTGGDGQSAIVGSAFGTPLQLSVTNAYTEPVDGGQVVLTAPATGASIDPAVFTLTISGGTVAQVVTANMISGGPYTVTAHAAGALDVEFALTNTKRPATVTLGSLSQVYDGTPKSVTATTDPAGLTVTVTYDGSTTPPTGAGSYAVVATVDDAAYEGSASDTLVVAKAVATVTLGSLGQVYDGTSKSVTATTDPAGLTVIVTYDGLATPPTGAGSYAVVATVDEANYEGSASDTLVVAKANATVTLGSLSQVYDGTPKSVTTSTGPAGLTVIVTYDGSTTPPTGAGSYAVVATVDEANYEGSASDTLVVAKGSTVTTLQSAPNPVRHGDSVTLTATVTMASPVARSLQVELLVAAPGEPATYGQPFGAGPIAPTGTITFTEGETVLGMATLVNGVATVVLDDLSVGTHAIVARYGGDDNLNSSGSAAVQQKVELWIYMPILLHGYPN